MTTQRLDERDPQFEQRMTELRCRAVRSDLGPAARPERFRILHLLLESVG